VASLPPDLTGAEARLRQGDLEAACHEGERVAGARPGWAPGFRFLGKCYMRQRRIAEARHNYGRYLELAPGAEDRTFIEGILAR
jgi:Flp pilus assembly protein TadD